MYVHRFVYTDQEHQNQAEKWNGKVRVLANKQDQIVNMIADMRKEFDTTMDKKLEAKFMVLNKKIEEQVGRIDLKIKEQVTDLGKKVDL